MPEEPIPVELDWPGRCARDVLPLVDAPPFRGLSRALVTEARALHEALGQGERPPNLDTFWALVKSEAAVRPRGLAAGPSWSPVQVVLHGSIESFALPCSLGTPVSAEYGSLHHRRVTGETSLGEIRRLASATRFDTCLSRGKRHVLAHGAPSASTPGSLAASSARSCPRFGARAAASVRPISSLARSIHPR